MAGISAALLSRCPSNFRAIWKVWTRILRLRDFTRSCGKTPVRSVNRSPEVRHLESRIVLDPVPIVADTRIGSWVADVTYAVAPWRSSSQHPLVSNLTRQGTSAVAMTGTTFAQLSHTNVEVLNLFSMDSGTFFLRQYINVRLLQDKHAMFKTYRRFASNETSLKVGSYVVWKATGNMW